MREDLEVKNSLTYWVAKPVGAKVWDIPAFCRLSFFLLVNWYLWLVEPS